MWVGVLSNSNTGRVKKTMVETKQTLFFLGPLNVGEKMQNLKGGRNCCQYKVEHCLMFPILGDPGAVRRVVKGIFMTRDQPFLFP